LPPPPGYRPGVLPPMQRQPLPPMQRQPLPPQGQYAPR
jgi:hypothetical protein